MKNGVPQNGFTLVELMVVAVIVAILAGVAIPLMSGPKKRAMASEGEAGLGMVRTTLRLLYTESGHYNLKPDGSTPITAPTAVTNLPGINAGDLDGKCFHGTDYSLSAVADSTYTVSVAGTGDLAGVTITLNEQGVFTRTGL